MTIISASVKINDVTFTLSVDTENCMGTVTDPQPIQTWLDETVEAIRVNIGVQPVADAVALAAKGICYQWPGRQPKRRKACDAIAKMVSEAQRLGLP